MLALIAAHGVANPLEWNLFEGIPESIARLFGKDVLPSIKAHGADGLSQREIASELEIASVILLYYGACGTERRI